MTDILNFWIFQIFYGFYLKMEWYNICQDALRKVDELYQGKETSDIIQNKVLQVHIILTLVEIS